jgi:uncharacterized integral membrane protein
MKTLYLLGSLIFTALIVLLALQNGSVQVNLSIFNYSFSSSPLIIIFVIAILGILTGALYHAFICRILQNPDSDRPE